MSLEYRLQRARDDYRSLPGRQERSTSPADPSTAGVSSAAGQPRRLRSLALAGAAAAVLLVAAGTAVLVLRDGNDVEPLDTTGPTEGSAQDVEPEGAIVPHDAGIELEPSGPYAEGQEITVAVAEDSATDLSNWGVRLCAVIADRPGGRAELCDPTDPLDQHGVATVGRTSATQSVRLVQRVFTAAGYRDCAEPEVVCRLVVGPPDGPRASAPITFAEPADEPEATVEVTPGEDPGTFVVALDGVVPHPSWVEAEDRVLGGFEGWGPLSLSVCAFDGSTASLGTDVDDLWMASPERVVPEANCHVSSRMELDPDDLEEPLAVEVSPRVYGLEGWSDCLIDGCFVKVVQHTIVGFDEPAVFTGEVVVVAAVLPFEAGVPTPPRASVTIDEPPPYTADQEVTVQVADLPDRHNADLFVCRIDEPPSCRPFPIDALGESDVTAQIRLPDWLDECGPEECYLELRSSRGPHLPPMAAVALPVVHD